MKRDKGIVLVKTTTTMMMTSNNLSVEFNFKEKVFVL